MLRMAATLALELLKRSPSLEDPSPSLSSESDEKAQVPEASGCTSLESSPFVLVWAGAVLVLPRKCGGRYGPESLPLWVASSLPMPRSDF
eukprot:Gb_25015 [translate_table: standard]